MESLNLGCGAHYRDGWTNVDISSTGPGVVAHDLRRPLPFSDDSFDLVYHSHVLEHFQRDQAPVFLAECLRVLRPGGLLRVVVPDLEQIVRHYLGLLEGGLSGELVSDDYDWILLELFDQTVRAHSGGAMGDWLRRDDLPNREFVLERIGTEARRIMDAPRIEDCSARRATVRWTERFARLFSRERLIRWMLGEDYLSLQEGRFRRQGEVHQWMYDRYSLRRLLTQVGFENPEQRGADQSGLDGWSDWNLDTEEDGSVYKPDSLFMEARKPRT